MTTGGEKLSACVSVCVFLFCCVYGVIIGRIHGTTASVRKVVFLLQFVSLPVGLLENYGWEFL